MDTISQINEIVVNTINWRTVGIMIAIVMLGGLLYNLWHAKDYFFSEKFSLVTMLKENYKRLLWCLIFASTISFALNWIPGTAEMISNLTGNTLTFSAVGLLVFGGLLAKLVFFPIKRVVNANQGASK